MSPCCGPGFKTPSDATKGPKETLLYVICVQPDGISSGKTDYLATVDVDPDSPNYLKVLHRTHALHVGDELHHMGWNACSSCYSDSTKSRNKLVLPCLNSSRIYVVDTSTPTKPEMYKVIEPEELLKLDVSMPHTAHCLESGDVIVSTLGTATGEAKGEFLLIDSTDWTVKGLWTRGRAAPFGYDFWYQPYHDVLISTEWHAPSRVRQGFSLDAVLDPTQSGRHLNIYSWSKRELIQVAELGENGILPLEIRFLHDPKEAQGYVGCAFSSNIFRFFQNEEKTWNWEKVIDVAEKEVDGWCLPKIPGLISDILISMDDNFLYFSNWLHGDVRQYDIRDRRSPKLVGQLFLGGLLSSVTISGGEKVLPRTVQGTRVHGGPQMIQLSLDGTRLYVTTSLYSVWDKQFYPEMTKKGSVLLKINVNTDKGGLEVDERFIVDFGKEPNGPVLAHECRYPGGDCSSDIFLAK